jgi:hypothetical protein
MEFFQFHPTGIAGVGPLITGSAMPRLPKILPAGMLSPELLPWRFARGGAAVRTKIMFF